LITSATETTLQLLVRFTTLMTVMWTFCMTDVCEQEFMVTSIKQ
jgi:hypothetical protein